jgi:hypothetical protein
MTREFMATLPVLARKSHFAPFSPLLTSFFYPAINIAIVLSPGRVEKRFALYVMRTTFKRKDGKASAFGT